MRNLGRSTVTAVLYKPKQTPENYQIAVVLVNEKKNRNPNMQALKTPIPLTCQILKCQMFLHTVQDCKTADISKLTKFVFQARLRDSAEVTSKFRFNSEPTAKLFSVNCRSSQQLHQSDAMHKYILLSQY